MSDARRGLPSVDRLLREPAVAALLERAPRNLVVAAVREALAQARDSRSGPPADWPAEIAERLARRSAASLHAVLNATGVVLHTNLGRAPLAPAAIEAIRAVAEGYSTLEYDVVTGSRGSRADHCAGLLAGLTGAGSAFVVNNAAGALVLALNTAAQGKEVIISRGELIEIGGSFRIPDILTRSGAVLREVGTTNRTHLKDYEAALSERTGAVLTVHRSNFELSGFVSTPAPDALAAMAARAGVPYIYDVGSGLLADLAPWGLTSEPRVPDAIQSGADLVIFSGDKLLGGPQAGCLAGREPLIALVRKNPLSRALRADKLTLAGLEATLGLYHDPARAVRAIPVLRMLTMTPDELHARAERLLAACAGSLPCTLVEGTSAVGGGAFPGASLPTTLVALDPGALGAAGLALRLRLGAPPLVARVEHDRVLLDPRTLPEDSAPSIGDAIRGALSHEV